MWNCLYQDNLVKLGSLVTYNNKVLDILNVFYLNIVIDKLKTWLIYKYDNSSSKFP